MLYASSNCVRYREEAFDAIRRLFGNETAPHVAGRCAGSMKPPPLKVRPNGKNNHWVHNHKLARDYRFALVMENKNLPRYVTEKIVNAFASGSIPVYYGTTEVFQLFNRDAF